MIGYFLEVAQVDLVLASAPRLLGFMRWVKARLQNRRGAPPWQFYFELRKLFAAVVLVPKKVFLQKRYARFPERN